MFIMEDDFGAGYLRVAASSNKALHTEKKGLGSSV